jgi:lysozyme family protein
MILPVSALSLSIVNSDKSDVNQAIPRGQTTEFLNLLIRTATEKKPPSMTAKSCVPLPPTGVSEFPLLEATLAGGDLKRDAFRFVFEQEGSRYVARDGGRESSRYGILQATADRYGYTGSVKDMSRQQAETIYERIWQESGAAKLPRNLALIHFDTYVNSPAAAKKMLKSADGNSTAYLELRSERYLRLSSLRPERYGKYTKGWMNRIENLKSLVVDNRYTPSARAST